MEGDGTGDARAAVQDDDADGAQVRAGWQILGKTDAVLEVLIALLEP